MMTEHRVHEFPNLGIAARTDGHVRNSWGWSMGNTNSHNLYCKTRSTERGQTYYVHRLVAIAFIDNPDPVNFIQVDHIDGNRMNNHVTNLRWLSRVLNTFASRALNARHVPRWDKWRARVNFNHRTVYLGYHPTQKSATRTAHAYKEIAFNMLYLSGLTNDQREEEGPRQYLRASQPSFTVAVDLIHSRIRGSRTLRKQVGRLFVDFPFATTLTRFEKLVVQ
jgi:hypothetical protein